MSTYYYCQKCGGTFDPAHTQCPNCDAPDERDADIASLRASVERLTAERDEVVKIVPALRERLGTAHARAESAEATIARLAMVVRAGIRGKMHRFPAAPPIVDFTENDSPIYNAGYDPTRHADDCAGCAWEIALSSLTAEDRRRAGIEP